jgi:hypothetical protein
MMLCGAVVLSLCFLPVTTGAQSRIPDDTRREAHGRMQTLEGKALRVKLERTGGIAGMRMAATIDSESLSHEEASRLRELVEAAGFFNLPEKIGDPDAPGADQFLYTVAVEMEGLRHTVHTGDAAAPPALRLLIRWLTNVARKGRRSGGSP